MGAWSSQRSQNIFFKELTWNMRIKFYTKMYFMILLSLFATLQWIYKNPWAYLISRYWSLNYTLVQQTQFFWATLMSPLRTKHVLLRGLISVAQKNWVCCTRVFILVSKILLGLMKKHYGHKIEGYFGARLCNFLGKYWRFHTKRNLKMNGKKQVKCVKSNHQDF